MAEIVRNRNGVRTTKQNAFSLCLTVTRDECWRRLAYQLPNASRLVWIKTRWFDGRTRRNLVNSKLYKKQWQQQESKHTRAPISLTRLSVISGSRLTLRSKMQLWSWWSMRCKLLYERRIVQSRWAPVEFTSISYHSSSSSSSSLSSLQPLFSDSVTCQQNHINISYSVAAKRLDVTIYNMHYQYNR